MYPIFLYGSDGTISKMDACRIDALDHWCLRMLLGIKWHQYVRNDDIRRLTNQPKLTAIIRSCRLILFGHIVHMKRILLASPLVDWRRQPRRRRIVWLSTVQQDLRHHNLLSPKQWIWPRNVLCGGWCQRMALRNPELHARNDGDDNMYPLIDTSHTVMQNVILPSHWTWSPTVLILKG